MFTKTNELYYLWRVSLLFPDFIVSFKIFLEFRNWFFSYHHVYSLIYLIIVNYTSWFPIIFKKFFDFQISYIYREFCLHFSIAYHLIKRFIRWISHLEWNDRKLKQSQSHISLLSTLSFLYLNQFFASSRTIRDNNGWKLRILRGKARF